MTSRQKPREGGDLVEWGGHAAIIQSGNEDVTLSTTQQKAAGSVSPALMRVTVAVPVCRIGVTGVIGRLGDGEEDSGEERNDNRAGLTCDLTNKKTNGRHFM